MISGTNRESVDFVIVGAGSAGCTLYHQMAASIGGSYRIIEAGSSISKCPYPSPQTPLHYPQLFRSSVDWNYQTLPQEHLAHRKLNWPRGKGLGGSSLINAMIYLPGSPGDWAALAEDWNVNPGDLRQHLPHQIPTALWHNAEHPEIHPLTRHFIEACQNWRQQSPCNFLDQEEYTFGIFPRSTKCGRRVDAYQAFVAVQATAKQLAVETDTRVERILFDHQRAVAVQCSSKGKAEIYTANKGIILCAGTIESPAILMRSGIGEAAHLESLRIPVLQDLPGVGRNLQDHLLMPMIYESKSSSLTNQPTLTEQQHYRWYGQGPLASNIAEAGCFMPSQTSSGLPDLQIHFTPTHYLEYPIRPEPTQAFSLGLTLLQPHSRGRITLASADPYHAPLIDPAYCSDPRDMHMLIDGVEQCRQLAILEPLASIRGHEILPGEKRATGSALERAVRAFVQTVFHPVGTCAVGDSVDSVVDREFRVHGTEGLHVVDASVFNRIPACNPAAQIMALASLAATRIACSTSLLARMPP